MIARRFFFLLLIVSVLPLPRFAHAEESLDDLKARLEQSWMPWKGCEVGSWVQTRSRTKSGASDTEAETRQTLVARTEKGLTVETRAVKRKKGEKGEEVVELGEPTSSILPAKQPYALEKLKDLPHEDVEVGGRKYDCRVVEMEWVYKYPEPVAGRTEMRFKMTIWISDQLQDFGGVAKTQGDGDKQGVMGVWSYDMKLVEIGKALKIGDKTVRCSVFKYGNATQNEESTTSGETWSCIDLPTGTAKSSFIMNYKSGAASTRMEMESEVTGFEIVRPKQE